MRTAYIAFGAFAYAVFGVSLVWAVLFLTGLGRPPLADTGIPAPAPVAVAVDLALLALFGVQHSVMARSSAKAAIRRVVPEAAGRSLFVLAAAAVLLLLFWQWRSLPEVVWRVPGALGLLVSGLALAGWAALVASTFMIDHLDLFGLKQSWTAWRHRQYRAPAFQTRWLYGWIRHPLMTSFLVIFWAVPVMTAGRLLFALAASGYIAVGIWFEERDLRQAIPEYDAYARLTGAVLPRFRRRGSPKSSRHHAAPTDADRPVPGQADDLRPAVGA